MHMTKDVPNIICFLSIKENKMFQQPLPSTLLHHIKGNLKQNKKKKKIKKTRINKKKINKTKSKNNEKTVKSFSELKVSQ